MKTASALVLTVMFFCTQQVCFSQNGNLFGKVSDSNTREELGGTKITISNKQISYSDMDGNFSLQNIPAGKYTITFSSLGYSDFKKEIEIKEDETFFLETFLSENNLESMAVLTAKK